jgi:AraC-like DNA-binding protein
MEMTICGGIDILRFLQAPAVVDGHAAKALGDLCEALAENAEAPRLPPLTLIARSRSLEYQLLDTLLTLVHWSGSQVETVESIAHVLPVLVAIQDNLAGDIRRDDLAALIGLSPAHFHAVFKAATGIPPMEYVIRLRIREAQSLLLQTTATVAEVAERSGFHDPFHFSRLFRSRCGVSPAQYRRETRSLPVGGG